MLALTLVDLYHVSDLIYTLLSKSLDSWGRLDSQSGVLFVGVWNGPTYVCPSFLICKCVVAAVWQWGFTKVFSAKLGALHSFERLLVGFVWQNPGLQQASTALVVRVLEPAHSTSSCRLALSVCSCRVCRQALCHWRCLGPERAVEFIC